MITVRLTTDAFDCHGYVYVRKLANAVLDAMGGKIVCTEKTSDWFRENAESDTSARERYPVLRERAIWAKIDSAVHYGRLRAIDPDTHAPRERSDIADAVVSFDEVVKWGEWLGLYCFKADAGSKDVAVRVGAGTTAATPSLTEIRIDAIVQTATRLEYDPLYVATGGKAIIRAECLDKLKGDPHRFTPDTFKKAWQAARDAGRIDVEDVKIYRGQ